jgi:hypothetical protein
MDISMGLQMRERVFNYLSMVEKLLGFKNHIPNGETFEALVIQIMKIKLN